MEADPFDDDDALPINQEDCWEVISAYFEEKGLVRQQLDSFDEFIMNTMQVIVDECAQLELVPQQQHNPLMQSSGARKYRITFGQIYLSKPTWVEPDQTTNAMFPNEARLRNLTYAAPLYMDLKRVTVTVDADGVEDEEEEEFSKVFLGQVPIMLRSTYCILSESNDRELTDLGECPYDQVRRRSAPLPRRTSPPLARRRRKAAGHRRAHSRAPSSTPPPPPPARTTLALAPPFPSPPRVAPVVRRQSWSERGRAPLFAVAARLAVLSFDPPRARMAWAVPPRRARRAATL